MYASSTTAHGQVSESTRTHRLNFLTYMSAFLIIGVVFMHVRVSYFDAHYQWSTPLYAMSWPDRILDILFLLNPVSGFVFASGFRFQYSLMRFGNYRDDHGRFLYPKYVQKRVRRLIVPYISWTLIYMLVAFGRDWASTIVSGAAPPMLIRSEDIPGLLTGWGQTAYQLWYLPMLFFVTLVVVFFRYVLKRPVINFILYALFLVLCLALPEVGSRIEPLGTWMGYMINFELGVLCAIRFYNRGSWLSLRGVALVWSAVSVLRMIPLPGLFPQLLGIASSAISPLFLYTLIVSVVSKSEHRPTLFFRIGQLAFPIYLIHTPFITPWMVSLVSRFGLYNLWTLIPLALLIILISIVIYEILLRTLPRSINNLLWAS